MKYRVSGIDRTSGQRVTRSVQAACWDEAASLAERAMIVEGVELGEWPVESSVSRARREGRYSPPSTMILVLLAVLVFVTVCILGGLGAGGAFGAWVAWVIGVLFVIALGVANAMRISHFETWLGSRK